MAASPPHHRHGSRQPTQDNTNTFRINIFSTYTINTFYDANTFVNARASHPDPGKGGRRGGVLYAHGSARPYHTNTYTWIFQHLQSTPAPEGKSEEEGKMIKCLSWHLRHPSELISYEIPLPRYEASYRSRVRCGASYRARGRKLRN